MTDPIPLRDVLPNTLSELAATEAARDAGGVFLPAAEVARLRGYVARGDATAAMQALGYIEAAIGAAIVKDGAGGSRNAC